MDTVLQTELILNMINTLFGKAIFFQDAHVIKELSQLRHSVYYAHYHYDEVLKHLEKIDIILQAYE